MQGSIQKCIQYFVYVTKCMNTILVYVGNKYDASSYQLCAGFLLGLFLDLEDGSDVLSGNVS
jgi:hypothetical protein